MSQGHGANFDRAQAAYDAKEPPEDRNSGCEDGHDWKFCRSRYDGWENELKEYECRVCGAIMVK
jgi:hypothetical protein